MTKDTVTGIDVGSSKITTIIANKQNDQISVVGVATYKSRGIKKGVIVNIDDAISSVSECLEAAERMAGFNVSEAYISLGCKQISSTNNKGVVAISKDEIGQDDITRAIDSAKAISIPQSREIMHVIPKEFIVDSQGGIKDPSGMSGIRLEVDTHIITVSSMVYKNLEKCINQVGLAVKGVVFSGWADAEIMLSDTEKELGVMLVDIGFGVSDIVIYQEDSIVFSASVPIGSANITNDIAIGLRLSIQDAEKVKVQLPSLIKHARIRKEKETNDSKYMYAKKPQSAMPLLKTENLVLKLSDIGIKSENGFDDIPMHVLDDIINSRLEEIFASIEKEVSASGFNCRMPSGVVFTGGGSKLASLKQEAQRYFSTAVRIGIPNNFSGSSDEISGPMFSTVQGLIAFGFNQNSKNKSQGGRPSLRDFGKENTGGIIGWIKSLIP